MPPITTTFACDPGLTRRSYRACHRKAFIIRWVAVVGIIGLGLASRLPFLALFGLFYALIAEVSVRRQLRSRHPGTTQVTVTMTDDGYRTDVGNQFVSRSWTSFKEVRRVGDFGVLKVSTQAAQAFPSSTLDASQTLAFEDLIRRKGLQP